MYAAGHQVLPQCIAGYNPTNYLLLRLLLFPIVAVLVMADMKLIKVFELDLSSVHQLYLNKLFYE